MNDYEMTFNIYFDEELRQLLKKPNTKKCDFIEYRNYMICQFFMGVGCRTRTRLFNSMQDYNKKRGVNQSGLHRFRYTFAKK
jgi:hypothetical protein